MVVAPRRVGPPTPAEVPAPWRAWVHRCIRMGGWAVVMALIALVCAVLLASGAIHWPANRTTGASPLAVVTAFGNAVLLLGLARGWLWPRWPEQAPTGTLGTVLDPLGNALPLVTAVILGANLGAGLTALSGVLAVVQTAAAAIGLALLAGTAWRRPRP